MADPASILGTAVGVTSLGIQACQALSNYYSHFRAFDDDISAIINRLDGLGQTLETLESLRPRVEISDNAVSSQLQNAIEKCAIGFSNLQKMSDKCRQSEIPITAQDKRKALKKRLMWPFRRETVASMITTLDGLQANVQLAVQLLDIEASHRVLQSLEASSNLLIARVEHLQNNQVQALTIIQQGFTVLSRGRMSSNEAVKLLDESKQMCSQLANMEKKPDMLLAADNVYHTQFLTKAHTSQAMRMSSRCTCCKTRQTQRWWQGLRGLIDLETISETEHSQTCQLSQHGNTTFTFQADFKLLKRLLNLEIRAGVSYMRMSGCYSMQPMLTIKPIVSKTSPSFAPLYEIRNKISCTCWWERLYCGKCGTAATAPSLFQTALNEAIQSFHDGMASPYDTTERGLSVLNFAYDVAFHMIQTGHLDGHTAVRLLDEFVHGGYFLHLRELTHVEFGFETEKFFDSDKAILQEACVVYSHRISIADSWADNGHSEYSATSAFKHQLLRSEENLSKFEQSCTLLTALHQRSKVALHEAISMHDRDSCESCLSDGRSFRVYLAARHWPDGLKILLSLSQSRACRLSYILLDDIYVDFLVELLAREANWDSLHTLAQTDPRVYWLAFNRMCRTADPGHLHDFLHGMHDRLVSGEATTILEHPELCEETTSPSYFHVPNLEFESMHLLLEAGFMYGDESMYVRVGSTSHFGTPSWIHAFQVVLRGPPWSLDWRLLELMVSYGARLGWEQPELLITPAHLIGLGLNKRAHRMGKITSPLLMQALSCEHFDSCSCACSSSGCLPIGCATGGITSNGDADQFFVSQFMTVCDILDQKPTEINQFALAVLRVLTFDALGLTHTCCRRFIGQRDAWYDGLHVLKQDPEDIEAIRFSEARDLEALEALMAELEQAWNGFSGTFLSYLKLVWMPIMQDAHDRLSAESENEIVQRMGQDGLYVRSVHNTEDGEGSSSAGGEGGITFRQWLISLEVEDNIGYDSDGSTASIIPLQETVDSVDPQDPAQPGTDRTEICLNQHDFDTRRVGVHGKEDSERRIPERRQSI